ncbi:MAG: isoprenylcysteine carboxylmethyltransferase family protein [Bacteroidetes bacterium]|nr:isoprenylcysteine carboxylmethyltransferase family protein [Bacteroidota bacterium]
MMWLKFYLPVYLVLYIMVAFVLPSYRTYKQTGINPIAFGKTDNTHDYTGFVMKVLIALLFVTVLIYSFSDKIYQYLVPISYLMKHVFLIIGLILIHLSIVWISVAQYQMSNSWRIGIDENNKTELITKGLFSYSRNPIFLGIIVSVAGIFFILPNALTFFLMLSTCIVIQIQIRLEEEFLEKQHGEKYLIYKKTTKRLL